MTNEKDKSATKNYPVQLIPPLRHAYSGYTHEDKKHALLKFI